MADPELSRTSEISAEVRRIRHGVWTFAGVTALMAVALALIAIIIQFPGTVSWQTIRDGSRWLSDSTRTFGSDEAVLAAAGLSLTLSVATLLAERDELELSVFGRARLHVMAELTIFVSLASAIFCWLVVLDAMMPSERRINEAIAGTGAALLCAGLAAISPVTRSTHLVLLDHLCNQRDRLLLAHEARRQAGDDGRRIGPYLELVSLSGLLALVPPVALADERYGVSLTMWSCSWFALWLSLCWLANTVASLQVDSVRIGAKAWSLAVARHLGWTVVIPVWLLFWIAAGFIAASLVVVGLILTLWGFTRSSSYNVVVVRKLTSQIEGLEADIQAQRERLVALSS